MTRKALYVLLGLFLNVNTIHDYASLGWLVEQGYVRRTTEGQYKLLPRGISAVEGAQTGSLSSS